MRTAENAESSDGVKAQTVMNVVLGMQRLCCAAHVAAAPYHLTGQQ